MARGTQKVCRREAVTIAAGTLVASALCAGAVGRARADAGADNQVPWDREADVLS